MTKVLYDKHKDKFYMVIKGHAGFAEIGNDIVCSAISMLVQTLIAHMEEVAEDFEASVNPGDVWLRAAGKEAVASADTVMTGFKLLEQHYPKYIKVDKGVPYT